MCVCLVVEVTFQRFLHVRYWCCLSLWCQTVSKTLQMERYPFTSSLVQDVWFFLRMSEERPPSTTHSKSGLPVLCSLFACSSLLITSYNLSQYRCNYCTSGNGMYLYWWDHISFTVLGYTWVTVSSLWLNPLYCWSNSSNEWTALFRHHPSMGSNWLAFNNVYIKCRCIQCKTCTLLWLVVLWGW